MIRLLAKDSTFWVLRTVGFVFLTTFLFLFDDYEFSIFGAIGYFAIAVLVPYLMVGSKLSDHFPKLNRYYFFPANKTDEDEPLSDEEWAVRQATYLEAGFRGKEVLFTPSEDGLICVPILLVGINPFTAFLGGLTFGFLHLGRFTYFECIGKAVIYGLVCYLILPLGLLTLVAGHLITDLVGVIFLKLIKKRLKAYK